MSGYGMWQPYVSQAERRKKSQALSRTLSKKGVTLSPVVIEGRLIARSFWGKSWCQNLELYGDCENRLPRGRTYVRNGSVIDLQIFEGRVTARVCGSSVYTVKVEIKPLSGPAWTQLKKKCTGSVTSAVELLMGKISDDVMRLVTDPATGLFPGAREISFACSCPDSARMCKHVAAALYGIGARLDVTPELLFKLRGVDHRELVTEAVQGLVPSQDGDFEAEELGALFGIDMEEDLPAPKKASKKGGVVKKKAAPAPSKKKSVVPVKKKAAPAPSKKKTAVPVKKKSVVPVKKKGGAAVKKGAVVAKKRASGKSGQ